MRFGILGPLDLHTDDRGPARRFDLVIGADGLHSHTRSLVFGGESRCLRFLDHYVAGFAVPNDLGLDRTGRQYSEPGRAIAVGNYDGDADRAGALLVFRSEGLSYDRRRMYRLPASRPLAAFFKRLTEKSATNIKLPEYPV